MGSFIISALHGMPARTSDEKGVASVRPSVGLSNVWIVTKQKKILAAFLTRCME